MKQQFVRIAMLAALVLTASCKDETPAYITPDPDPSVQQVGYLSVSASGLSVLVDAETDQGTDATSPGTRAGGNTDPGVPQGSEVAVSSAGEVPDDFIVKIESEQGSLPYFKYESTYGELKRTMSAATNSEGKAKPYGLEVPVGKYALLATSNTTEAGKPSGVQLSPSYAARVEDITVEKEQTANVGTVTCRLQNIKVSITLAADLYEQLVPLGEGYADGQLVDASIYYADAPTVRWDVPADWEWTQTDPRPVYFPALQEERSQTLNLCFTAKVAGDDMPITITKEISGILKGQWRRIKVIPKYDTTGTLYFDVEISSFVQDEEIVVGDGANASLSVKWRELPYDDPEAPSSAPEIRWADGSALPETIEVGKTPLQEAVFAAPGGLSTVALRFAATNPAFADDERAMNLSDLCTVVRNAALNAYGIPYGAALKDQTEVRFSFDALLAQIRDFAGEYRFTFTMTDRTGSVNEQTLCFLNGSAGDAGAAPTIVWHMATGTGTLYDETGFDADGEAIPGLPFVELTEDMEIDLELTANPNFESIKVVITSASVNEDVLTEMNIPPVFDLCHLQTYTYLDRVIPVENQKTVFTSLELVDKFDEDMRREHTTSFNITSFVPVLMGFCEPREKVQFSLTVEDAQGRSVTKYLRLQNQ